MLPSSVLVSTFRGGVMSNKETQMAQYSSFPVMNFKLGEFQFNGGQLNLDSEEEEAEFDRLLSNQPAFIKAKVRKLSADAAAELAIRVLGSRMVQGVDTTSNSIEAQQPADASGTGADSPPAEEPKKPSPLSFGKRTAEG